MKIMNRSWCIPVLAAMLISGCGKEEVKVIEAVDTRNMSVVVLKGPDTVLKNIYDTDMVIVGGSLGALTAAIASCESGYKTMLIQEAAGFEACFADTNSYFENKYVNTTGSSVRVKKFKGFIQNWYKKTGNTPPEVASDVLARFAGYGVEPFCFGNDAAMAAVDSMLSAYKARGRLTVLHRHKVVAVRLFGTKIASLTVVDLDNHVAHLVRGWIYIDATETGELLPLAGIDFAIGNGDSAAAYDTFYYEDTLAGKSSGTAVMSLLKEKPGSGEPVHAVSIPRETRRMKAIETVTENELQAENHPGPRAAFFNDSVGIGYSPVVGMGNPTDSFKILPFQIPLGAMIPPNFTNYVVGGPSIGASFMASAAYSSPSTLLAIGESAGVIAEFCAKNNILTQGIRADETVLRKLQQFMVEHRGIPLYWYDNVVPGSKEFPEAQMRPFLEPGFNESQKSLSYPGPS